MALTHSASEASFARLLRMAAGEYVRDYARYFASAMVYYALLSLVPLLVLALAALGWLLRLSDLASEVERRLLELVSENLGDDLVEALPALLARLEESSVLATLIGVVGLMLTASLLFKHLRMTFRALWKHAPPLASGSLLSVLRDKFMERLIAFWIVLGGGLLLLGLLAGIAILQRLALKAGAVTPLGDVLTWLLAVLSALVVVPATFAFLYKSLAPVALRWSDVWFGAAFAGLAWILGAELLGLYAAYAAEGLSAYGAIGGVLIIMLWMQAVSQVLFFGAELCKVCWRRARALEHDEAGRRGIDVATHAREPLDAPRRLERNT